MSWDNLTVFPINEDASKWCPAGLKAKHTYVKYVCVLFPKINT